MDRGDYPPAGPPFEPIHQPEYETIGPHQSSATPNSRRRTTGVDVLAAAMLAVGEIIEPEKTEVHIIMPTDAPGGDDGFDLDFGGLDPL